MTGAGPLPLVTRPISAVKAVARPIRRSSALLLLAGLLLAALAAACGGSDNEAGVLATLSATSGDLEVVVEIPEGALPSGVALSDISVVGLDRDEALAGYEGADPLGAYRLEPAGMEFEVPLRLTVELAAGSSHAVARLVSSDGTAEFLEPVALAIRRSDDRVRVSYKLEHFSDLHFVLPRERQDPAVVVLPPEPKPSYFVGESFTVRVRVHSGFYDQLKVDRVNDQTTTKEYRTLLDTGWSARLSWWSSAAMPAESDDFETLFEEESEGEFHEEEPSPLDPATAATTVGEANIGTASFAEQTFTCALAGEFLLSVVAVVSTSAEVATSVDGGPATVRKIQQYVRAESRQIRGICVGADATVDPTPDPTETVATPETTATPDPTEEPTVTATPPPIAATLEPGFDPCHINANEDTIDCLPHYDVTSASSRVRTTPDRHLIYEGTWEFGAPIPINPEHAIEYWLVLEGNGQRMEFLLEGAAGQPLTCTRTVNGAPSALGPGEACGQLIAPNTLQFAGDITAFAPGGLVRTFSTLEIGAGSIARGDYLRSGGEEAWELSVPQ